MATLPQTATHKAIAALWQRNQPQLLERLAILDRAAVAPALTPGEREEAVSTAHKLAGSLGMFGFHEGTRIARELEQKLETASEDGILPILTAELRAALFPPAS